MTEKLKICIVTAYPTQGAGSGTLITAQAKTYVDLGYEPIIITANNNTAFAKVPGVKYHLVPFTAEKEPVEVIPGQLPFNFIMFTSHTNSSENFDRVSMEQIELYCNKFKEVYEKVIAEDKPDVFHGQHCWISTAILCDYGIPVITTIHGTDMMGYENAISKLKDINAQINAGNETAELLENKVKYEFYMSMAEKAARDSKEIWVISHQQEAKFKSLFPFAADKVKLVRNGCDTSVFHKVDVSKEEVLAKLKSNITTDGKIPYKDGTKIALFVGKFAQFKRVDLVLRAAAIYEEKMKSSGKDVQTIIVGAGALDEELRNLQKELGLTNTHFVGRQEAPIVRELNSISDVFLAPSDNEPDGLVYKECMLCGNVPVGTLGGGVPDTINPTDAELTDVGGNVYPTKYGVLVPMGDEKALAEAAMYVLNNDEMFNRGEIMAYAKEFYDQKNISKNVIIPAFKKIIGE